MRRTYFAEQSEKVEEKVKMFTDEKSRQICCQMIKNMQRGRGVEYKDGY